MSEQIYIHQGELVRLIERHTGKDGSHKLLSRLYFSKWKRQAYWLAS
ncbi:hypothetical protein MOC27_21765 [Bacillus inaquosorum]|nr:hypothetical protein [Bacillus inaquosorum]MCY8252304.1 hypothetical protein [Bacillus inaquosorum]